MAVTAPTTNPATPPTDPFASFALGTPGVNGAAATSLSDPTSLTGPGTQTPTGTGTTLSAIDPNAPPSDTGPGGGTPAGGFPTIGAGVAPVGFGIAPAFGQMAATGIGGGIGGPGVADKLAAMQKARANQNVPDPFGGAFRRVRAMGPGPGTSGMQAAQPDAGSF